MEAGSRPMTGARMKQSARSPSDQRAVGPPGTTGSTEIRTLNVALAERSYPIHIGAGVLRRAGPLLAELAVLTDIVLSTGGGVVLRPANRARLRENGTVVYLHAEPATLYARVRHSRNRPLLQTADHVVGSERGEVMRFARMFETGGPGDGTAEPSDDGG